MTQHRNFATNDVFPAGFLDALEQFLGTHASNFQLVRANATTIALKDEVGNDPGSDNTQVSIAIQGRWRFIAAALNAAVPGGLAAGIHNIWVGSPDNNPAQEDAGTFDYSFSLILLDALATPTTAIYRKVGTFWWDGAQIISVHQTVGRPQAQQSDFLPGMYSMYASMTQPPHESVPGKKVWLLCNGALVLTATYPELFRVVGHNFNRFGGTGAPTDPGGGRFKLPDLPGRVPITAGGQSQHDSIGKSDVHGTRGLSHRSSVHDPGHQHGLRLNSASDPHRGVNFTDGTGNFVSNGEDISTAAGTGITVGDASASPVDIVSYQAVGHMLIKT